MTFSTQFTSVEVDTLRVLRNRKYTCKKGQEMALFISENK